MKPHTKTFTFFLLSAVLWLASAILLIAPNVAAGENTPLPAEMEPYYNSIMRPDKATLQKWQEEYELAPAVYIDPDIKKILNTKAKGVYFDLLDYIKYDPQDRNQGDCGNCWVWAGTGILEIALKYQNGIKNRLSIQYLNSCCTSNACCGGNPVKFSQWYNSVGFAIPWSNTNAWWRDWIYGRKCKNNIDPLECNWIDDQTHYPITYIESVRIPTNYMTQAQAITNIKNVLLQNRGIYLSFTLESYQRWSNFINFWKTEDENKIWDVNHLLSIPGWEDGGFGSHGVLIVGYDESDPAPDKHSWVVLNSWGTTDKRSNGLFRIPMHLDYQSTYHTSSRRFKFYTLNVEFDAWCSFELTDSDNPPLISPLLAASGDNGTVDLHVTGFPTYPSACTWEIETDNSWLHVADGPEGSGNIKFHYFVDPNPTFKARIATLRVANQIYFVHQAGNPPETPDGVTATDGGYSDRIRISWYEAAGADSYNIFRRHGPPPAMFTLIGNTEELYFEDTTAAENTVYDYYVKAINECGPSQASNSDSGFINLVIGPPAVPSSLSASNGNYRDRVRVSWNEASGATAYVIYRAPDTGGITMFNEIARTSSKFYDDYSAELAKNYLYRVTGWNGFGESSPSASDQGYRSWPIYPAMPDGVAASNGTFTDKIQISWNPAVSATGYIVYRALKSDGIMFFTPVGDTNNPQYDDNNVQPGKFYTYKIKAQNYFGESDLSEGDDGYMAMIILPDIPTGLTASDGDFSDMIHLSWNPVAGATYKIYRAPVSNWVTFYNLLEQTGNTEYNDTSARLDTRYYYSIRASNGFGDSNYSESDLGWRNDENACHGDLDADLDVDGLDLFRMTLDYNRHDCCEPDADFCYGNIDADCEVTESDLIKFAGTFGRTECPE